MEHFDDLAAFASWWINNRVLCPPPDAVTTYENMTGTCLYRSGCYQVQMFTARPNSSAPSHIHPNVDSYELYMCGDLDFIINNKLYSHTEVNNNAVPVRIFPTYWHEGKTGPLGGSFLSLQKWLNNTPPSCVGRNWLDVNGETVGSCTDNTED